MDEYISKEAALKKLCYKCNNGLSEEPCEPSDCFILEAIRSLPAADVAPVRHGRWVNEDFPDEQADATDPAICSECKEPAHKAEHGYAILSKYCHNCGAKMDKEDKL